MQLSNTNEVVPACVLQSSPNVLSVGQLCSQGWKFIWTNKERPRLITPNGKVLSLQVNNHVPYLSNTDRVTICTESGGGDHAQEFPLLTVEDLTSSARTPESGAIDEVPMPSSESHLVNNIDDQSIPEFHKNLKLVALSKDH